MCTSRVQDALSKVTGVSEVVSVSSADNTAVVKVEKGKVKTADLTTAVQGVGFRLEQPTKPTTEAPPPQIIEEITLTVTGMT